MVHLDRFVYLIYVIHRGLLEATTICGGPSNITDKVELLINTISGFETTSPLKWKEQLTVVQIKAIKNFKYLGIW